MGEVQEASKKVDIMVSLLSGRACCCARSREGVHEASSLSLEACFSLLGLGCPRFRQVRASRR